MRSKTYLSNKLNLPTHIDSCSVSDGLRNPESSKRKITYFLDVSSQISTYSDLQLCRFFSPCFSLLLLKAFFFIANFLLPGSLVQYGMCVGLKFWSRIYGPAMVQMIFYFCLFYFCLGSICFMRFLPMVLASISGITRILLFNILSKLQI